MKPAVKSGIKRKASVTDRTNDSFISQPSLIIIVLVGMTVLGYWGVWKNDFVNFDDTQYVVENRLVKKGLTWEGVGWAFTSFHASNWHPLTWLSHMLDVTIFGMWPGGHHITNLVFHLLNTILLFLFLKYATQKLWPSALVAALFSLHPLHVESVAWVSERKDVLSAFFWFAALWTYLWFTRNRTVRRYIAVVVIYALGLMSKPMLVTLPFVLLLLDYWPLNRFSMDSFHKAENPGKTWDLTLFIEKIPLLVMAAASSMITIVAQRPALTALDRLDLGPRITNAAISYMRYLGKMLLPVNLAPFYPYINEAQYLKAAIALLAICIASYFVIRVGSKVRYLAVGWFWYLITLLPVIGIVRVGAQSHADRYTYIPLVGVFIAIIWSIADAIRKKPGLKRIVTIAAAVILLSMTAITQWNVRQWKDSYTFALRAVKITNSVRMLLILASSQMDRGEYDAALANLREAERISSENAEVLSGLGQIMLKTNRYQEAAACCERALAIEPERREVWLNAGLAYGHMGQTEKALVYLKKAIDIDPYWAQAYSQYGRILAETGRFEEGIDAYMRAIELDDSLPECRQNLGVLYMQIGRFDLAAEQFRAQIALEPDALAWSNLGGCLVALKLLEDAQTAYIESLKIKPDNAQTCYNLAVVLASLGKTKEAVGYVRKSIELDPDNEDYKNYLETLLVKDDPSQLLRR